MENGRAPENSLIVRVFTAFIVVLGLFCNYVVVVSFIELLRNPFENLSPWVNLSMWLDAMLTALISLAILYQLYRLVRMIARGNPFGPENPRRIRNVAYGVLGISISNLVFSSVRNILLRPGHADWSIAANILIKGSQRVFFILGLLIIAKLVDLGVRLQQDQNLTV